MITQTFTNQDRAKQIVFQMGPQDRKKFEDGAKWRDGLMLMYSIETKEELDQLIEAIQDEIKKETAP